jgi:ABC-type sugar transport system ATPase subunit
MRFLQFDNVTFGYNATRILFRDLSFRIECKDEGGHAVSIMGASASGKTTILKLILNSVSVSNGSIIHSPMKPVISYVPQEPVLFDHLSPMQNAAYFSRLSFYRSNFDQSLIEKFSEVLEMKKVLTESKSISELSGGQRQRLSLLRALSIKPDILLLDEPTTGIDADLKLQFILQLLEVIREQNILAIYVTHHKSEAQLVANEILYLFVNSATGVASVFQRSASEFFDSPPTAHASRSIGYPNSNLIAFKIESDVLKLATLDDKDSFLLNIEPEHIFFSDDKGFAFKVVRSNGIFSMLRLDNGQPLVIKKLLSYRSDKRVYFSGRIYCYNCDGLLNGQIELHENRIFR